MARRSWRRVLFMIVFLLALGGVITLATEPFFPGSWTTWIADVQEGIAR